jgi:pimeloyl-ACP methyl ester carboxylesterase
MNQGHLRDLAETHDDPTIVLVPGIDGTALLFYRQIPLLSKRFNVVAFPLPDDPRASMCDLVEDLHELIGEVADDGVILCGESFGGALSMSTALTHPKDIRGLVVINSFPWLEERLQLRLAPTLLRLMPWAAMPLVRKYTEDRIHSSHTRAEDLAEFHERARAIGRRGYIRRMEMLRDYDLRGRLGGLKAPALFLGSDEDQLVPSARWARWMASQAPAGSVEILRGYGHSCLITHDLDLSIYVEAWWDHVSGRPTTPGAKHAGGSTVEGSEELSEG